MSTENGHTSLDAFRKYFTGKMTADEKAAFEQHLEKDAFAKEAYEGFMILESDLKKTAALEKAEENIKAKSGVPSRKIFPWRPALALAASLIVLLSAFFVVQNGFLNQNDTTIAENKVQEEPANIELEKEEIVEDLNLYNQDSIQVAEEEDEAEVVEIQQTIAEEPIERFANEEPKVPYGPSPEKKQINAEDYYNTKDNATTFDSDDELEEVAEESITETDKAERNTTSSTLQKTVLSNYKNGILAYNTGNYTEAVKQFEQSIKNKQNISSSNYYIGMSYFNMNKHNLAIKSFDKIINTNSKFADDAMWYKALSLVNKGQKQKAKTLLRKIINSNSNYGNLALKKLNALE